MIEEKPANKILISEIKMPNADTEYAWAFPQGCRWFSMHVRDGAAIRIAVEPSKVANSEPPYFTLKANTAWDERDLVVDALRGHPLYFACASAGKVVEVFLGIYDPKTEVENA